MFYVFSNNAQELFYELCLKGISILYTFKTQVIR